ncbi:MAG: 2-hydroxyacyl-CoA dehydratase, partial [Kiritimatiellae bacterium]|nr:2-hydroxyacyl-CoA dehydratase [Kiritimatiellia bacterium]
SKHLDFIENVCNAPIVFEETNFVGWEMLDPKDPYRSLARKLLQSGFLDPAQRVGYVKEAVPAGKFNGVILYTHGFGRCSLADRSFSKLLRDTLDSIGCPLLTLEGDCMDASIDPCSTTTKIASFVEALNLNRYGNIFGKTKH